MPYNAINQRFVQIVEEIRQLKRYSATDEQFYKELLDISYQTWTKIAALKRSPTYHQIVRLINNDLYRINLYWLFYGEGEMFEHDNIDHVTEPLHTYKGNIDTEKIFKMEQIINYIKKEL